MTFIHRLGVLGGWREPNTASKNNWNGKTIGQLEPHERCHLLIEIMRQHKCKIYVVNDILKEMPISSSLSLISVMELRASEGRYVLFLNSVVGDPPRDPYYQAFYENIMWNERINNLRSKIN